MASPQGLVHVESDEIVPQQPEESSRANNISTRRPAKKRKVVHAGEALGIFPNLTPHRNANTIRYQKGDIDVDSIIAFLSHLRGSNDMPKDILRVRGRIRDAFPGVGCTKPMIREAYEKAGWEMNEICWKTKKEKKAKDLKKISGKRFRDRPVCQPRV